MKTKFINLPGAILSLPVTPSRSLKKQFPGSGAIGGVMSSRLIVILFALAAMAKANADGNAYGRDADPQPNHGNDRTVGNGHHGGAGGDGLTDAQEESLGTDPTKPDTDFDGLQDGEESIYGTDPLDPDSDNGGMLNGFEVLETGTDPLNGADDFGAWIFSDSDRDGLSNATENRIGTDWSNPDTDGDGVDDLSEILNGTDPTVAE